MPTTRKTARKKPATAARRKAPAARKSSARLTLLKKSVPVADVEPVVNSPYQLFGPFLELIATPWRLFMPYTPWPLPKTRWGK